MTQSEKDAYIVALRNNGLEAKSAREAGVPLAKVRRYLDTDPDFAEEVDEVLACFMDEVEEEAIRRAVDGVEKPIYYMGEMIGTTTEYSDMLLSKILTGRRPKVYGDKKQITGKDDAPIQIQIREFDFV